MNIAKPKTVDEYIAQASPLVKEHLERMRIAILQVALNAQECISYELPAYKQDGIIVYFGGFSKHVSLFPGPHIIEIFKDDLTEYKTSGGTIRFSVDKRLPITLIKKIVKLRLKENLSKTKLKG